MLRLSGAIGNPQLIGEKFHFAQNLTRLAIPDGIDEVVGVSAKTVDRKSGPSFFFRQHACAHIKAFCKVRGNLPRVFKSGAVGIFEPESQVNFSRLLDRRIDGLMDCWISGQKILASCRLINPLIH